MEHLWIFLILLYGIFKGLREALKKKAMETNSVIEVLFFYTFFAFLLTIPFSQDVFSVSLKYHAAIIIKSFAIFIAWLCALNSIKRLPLSVYSVMDMGRMVFSILLGVIFLNENLRFLQIVGIALVITGITLVNLKKEKKADGKKADAPKAEEKKADAGKSGELDYEIYKVQPGDTLSAISKKFYGNARYSDVIFRANKDILQDANKLKPGMDLIIPKL